MKTQLRNAVLALAMLLPLTMNGQNNNAGHEMPQRKSITFPASDIQYWVGNGSNSAVVIIGWDDNPSGNNFALAWGVRWNGSATAANMLDTIATYDSRTTYPGINAGWMNGFYYNDGTLVSGSSASYWCYTINGGYAGAYGTQAMTNGDVMEISSSCYFTLTTATAATDPNPASIDTVDATIAFSDILYWVGSGSDSAVFIVNYAQPDTAFAWGYLFNGTTTAEAMVNAIAAADPRFEVVGSPSTGGDLHFVLDNGDTLGLSPVDPAIGYNFWWTNLNGVSAGAGAASTLHNGDVFKYGDMNSATGWNYQYGYYLEEAWTKTPTPVPAPSTTPVEATIDFADILYWVGTGSNEAVMAVNWADTALAWGYRWNGSATVADMMSDIAAADPRFSYTGTGFINDILFNDGNVSLSGTPGNYWGSTNNGQLDGGMSQTLADGDFEKWGDPAAGVVVDSNNYGGPVWYYTYAYPMTVYPVSVPDTSAPAPEDASIAASDILFWVGQGQNEVVFAINWADSALAWGYRFATDSVLVGDIVDAVATVDPRFSYEGSTSYITDFLYADSLMSDTLRLTPHNPSDYSIYFSLSVNHVASMLGAGQHMVVNGDFVKFADTYAAVVVDSTWVPDWGGYWDYTYVWPMTIHPVTVPDTTGQTPQPPTPPQPGSFCGAAGTPGSSAIAADSSAIVAWATGVVLNRGPQNITNPSGALASFGGDTNAIGMATMDNTMDAVSLGDGGNALVTFAHPIRNGEGPDFAVFENGFSDNSLELAFVEVSTDGQRFVRFPATCLTQNTTQLGNAGQTDPTNLNNLAGKYRIGFGTPFDLEELRDSTGINIDSIVYVRIVDVVGCIEPQYATRDQYGNIINDPWPTPFASSGFDLTGVAVMHERTSEGIADVAATVNAIWPNPTTNYVNVSIRKPADAVLYDVTGRRVAAYTLSEGSNVIDLTAVQSGVYMLRVEGSVSKIVKK